MFGRKTAQPQATSSPRITSLRVQTSVYGVVVPIVYGLTRLAGKMIWYGDFVAIPHTTTQSTGGKGGGGGSKSTTTTYTYQVAAAILLCEGQIAGLASIWDTKGVRQLNTAVEVFTVPGSPFQVTVANASTFINDLGVAVQQSYSQPVDDFGDDAPRTLSGNMYKPRQQVPSSPAAAQYSVSAGVYTFNSANAGDTVTITYTYAATANNPQTAFGLSVFSGSPTQSPWGYLTSNHPGQDLNYRNFAYVANPSFDCGDSGQLGNYNFEIAGLFQFGGAGGGDAHPDDIVFDIATNALRGAAFPTANYGSRTQFRNYCSAYGLFFSPALEQQQTAASWIDSILSAANTAAVWSEGLLKLRPYGDISAVANGATYLADTQPVYALTIDDLIADAKEGNGLETNQSGGGGSASGMETEPLTATRPSPQSAKNALQIEFLNRANSYNPEPIEEKDLGLIDKYGVLSAPAEQMHFITDKTVAAKVVNQRLKRISLMDAGSHFQFTLSWKYCLLEPMDVITMTYAPLGMSNYPMRVLSINEDPYGMLQVECEEFPFASATGLAYNKQGVNAAVAQQDADPPSVTQVMIIEPNNRTTQYNGYELWLLASVNDVNFGGCNVYASQDGTKYSRVGQILRGARMGVVRSSTYPSHADPDTTNTLHVDLSNSSGGALSSASASDNNVFKNLALVGGELISFQTATLVGTNLFDLTTIHRGVYGTTIGAHVVGEQFARLDDCVLVLDYAPEDVGKTIHFKFASFNTFGAREQSLASVSDHPITIGGVTGAIDSSNGFYNLGLDAIPDGVTFIRTTATQVNNSMDASGNLKLKNINTVYASTANPTYTGTTPALVPEMTMTLTTHGNKTLVLFCAPCWSGTFQNGFIEIYRDGSIIITSLLATGFASGSTVSVVDSPGAGSHTYEVKWYLAAQGGSDYLVTSGTFRQLQVVELG